MQNDQEKDQDLFFQQIGQNFKILQIQNKKINQLKSLEKQNIFIYQSSVEKTSPSIYIVEDKTKIDAYFKVFQQFIESKNHLIYQERIINQQDQPTYYCQTQDQISIFSNSEFQEQQKQLDRRFQPFVQNSTLYPMYATNLLTKISQINVQSSAQFSQQIMFLHIIVNLIKLLMQKIQHNFHNKKKKKKIPIFSFIIDKKKNLWIQEKQCQLFQGNQNLSIPSLLKEYQKNIIKDFLQSVKNLLRKNDTFNNFIKVDLNQVGDVLINYNQKLGKGTFGEVKKGFLFVKQNKSLIIKKCACKIPNVSTYNSSLTSQSSIYQSFFNQTFFFVVMQIIKKKFNKFERFFLHIPEFYGIFQCQKNIVLCIQLCKSKLAIQHFKVLEDYKFYNFVKDIVQGLYSMHYLQKIIAFALKKLRITQNEKKDLMLDIMNKLQKLNKQLKIKKDINAYIRKNIQKIFKIQKNQTINGYIHCDFKLQNLLFQNEQSFLHSKICDFGSIIFAHTQQLNLIDQNSNKLASTLYYRASQLIKSKKTNKTKKQSPQNQKSSDQNEKQKQNQNQKNQKENQKNEIKFNSKIDIWAFGITILQFFLKKNVNFIFADQVTPGVIKRNHKFLFKNKSSYIEWGNTPQKIKQFWENLMRNCLKQNINERWSSQQLLKYINQHFSLFQKWNILRDTNKQSVQIMKYQMNQKTIEYHLDKSKFKQLKIGIKLYQNVKKIEKKIEKIITASQSYCSLIQFQSKKQYKQFMKNVSENQEYSKMMQFNRETPLQRMNKHFIELNLVNLGYSLNSIIKESHSQIQIYLLLQKLLKFLNSLSWINNLKIKGFLLLILQQKDFQNKIQTKRLLLDMHIFMNSQFYQIKQQTVSSTKMHIQMVKVANYIINASQENIIFHKDLSKWFQLLKKYELIPNNIIIQYQVKQFIQQKMNKNMKLVFNINQNKKQMECYLRIFELQIIKIKAILNKYSKSKFCFSIIQYTYFLTQVCLKIRKLIEFSDLQQKVLDNKQFCIFQNLSNDKVQEDIKYLRITNLMNYFRQAYFKLYSSQKYSEDQEDQIQKLIQEIHQIILKLTNYQHRISLKQNITRIIDIKLKKLKEIIEALLQLSKDLGNQ